MKGLLQRRPLPMLIGSVAAVILLAGLAFRLLPGLRHEPSPEPIRARMPTKLELAGLPEGLDFEGVPAFFTAFADHAEWQDNLTRFAYWHPVMKTFSYHFEATRVGDRYHFREIPEPDKDRYILADDLPEECPIRFYRVVPVLPATNSRAMVTIERPEMHLDAPKVRIDPSLPESQPAKL